jgi:hypothetical protein
MLGLKNDPRCQELSGLADASAISPDAGRYRSHSELNHLIACGHHQGGLTGLVHAAEPASVGAYLLFIDAIILADLHRLAASRAWIAVAGNDDALLPNPLSRQIPPTTPLRSILPHKARTPARCERSPTKPSENGIKIPAGPRPPLACSR